MKKNVLIIEDEIPAAQALKTLIHEVSPDMEIITVLQSIDESVEWFQLNPMPDLVFMDIHLADGSSFTIFDEVTITCPIIFTTAYDEYALKAFEVNSIDYLLKPISKKDLERAILKEQNLKSQHDDHAALLNRLLTSIKQIPTNYKTHFLVAEKDKLIPLVVNDIAYICVDTKMIKAVTFQNKAFYLDQTLDELIQQLDSSLFFRANRQYIVAKAAIKDLSLWFGSKLSVNLNVTTPDRILVSKARVNEFKYWFVNQDIF